jgi:hypothetical protein
MAKLKGSLGVEGVAKKAYETGRKEAEHVGPHVHIRAKHLVRGLDGTCREEGEKMVNS